MILGMTVVSVLYVYSAKGDKALQFVIYNVSVILDFNWSVSDTEFNSNISWLTLYSIYTHFYTCATSVDPDQLAHSCCLIWICTGRILVRNNQMNQKVNSSDPDQMALMCRLIWI
jgi:hypothetical protein